VVEQRGARRRPGHLGLGCLREPDVASKVPPALSLSGRFQTRDVVDRRPQVDPPSLVFTPPSPQRRASVGRQGTLGLELGGHISRSVTGEVDVGNMPETLSKRVRDLAVDTGRREQPILSTTGTRAALSSLDARTQVLERQVRELSAIVHSLALSQRTDG
jgi:hypothetical protein